MSVCRFLAALDHRAPGDDREIVAFRTTARFAERQHKIIARIRPARRGRIEHGAMLEEDHGIIAAQRRAQQADRIFGVGWHRHLPARRMHELHFVGLAVPGIAAFEEADGMRTTIGAAKRLLVRQRIVPQSLSCSVAGSAYLRNWISGTGTAPPAPCRRRGR